MKQSPKPDRAPRSRLLTPYDPLTSLVLVVPVFLIYHLGILFIDIRNGVDMASAVFFRLLHQSPWGYAAATLGVAAALVVAGMVLRKRNSAHPLAFAPILLESTVLAFGMLLTVGWATQQLMLIPTLQMAHPLGPFEKVVMSAGAGFHEELVFRALLFGGLAAAIKAFGSKAWQAVLIAAVVSSALFSAVHYVGSLSDQFTFVSFTFRFLAGMYLAAVYRLRGFAVAVYTHAIYDVLVMFVFGA